MAINEKKDAVDMPSHYKPSLSTGVYGTYTTIDSRSDAKQYIYLPSVSCGVFGTWLYNDSSPYTNTTDTTTPKQTTRKTKPMKASSGYSSWFRKSEPIDYKFEIRGARNETIQNGKKYNVKLLQEYKLPIGQTLANMTKSKQPNTQQNTQHATATGTRTGTGTLFICEGSVVSFSGECIINAANEGMLGGGGVDGAISSAGGDALYHLREQVAIIKGSRFVRCRVGDAKCTQSGYPYNKLQCDYVIHAVGPNYSILYRGGKNMKMSDIDKFLYASYAKSMLICREKNIKSVGFCLISSGIFRGPRSLDDVLKLGIEAIRDHMFPGIEVFMIGYQNSELVCLSKVAPAVLGKMHKEYAKVKERKGWGGWGAWNRSKGANQDNGKDGDDGSGFFNFGWGNKKKRIGKSNKGKAKGNAKSGQKRKNDA